VKKIDSGNSLMSALYDREVIDSRDKEDLNAEKNPSRRNEKLLSMLGRKSKEKYGQFKEALNETGQQHVVEQLQREIDETRDIHGESHAQCQCIYVSVYTSFI